MKKSKKIVLPIILSTSGVQAQVCNDIESSQTTPTERFINNNDGTITDKATGLMWSQCVEGMSGDKCETTLYDPANLPPGSIACSEPRKGYCLDWATALTYAKSANLAGHNDWRLPNIKELHSIAETSCSDPALNTDVFPMGDGPASEISAYAQEVYSSSPVTDISDYGDYGDYGEYGVLTVQQTSGSISSSVYSGKQNVRLVRDIPENDDG